MAPAPPKPSVYRCIVYGCNTRTTRGEVKFHSVGGGSLERTKAWLAACKRLDLLDPLINLNTKLICSLHFEKRMYGKNRLRNSAFPTLRLPTNSNSPTINSPSTSNSDYRTEAVSADNINYIAETTTDDTSHAKASETIIKYEPPQPSEMTIEEEQIGYHHGAKRRRVDESFREDLRNAHISKVATIHTGDDDQTDLTLDDDIPQIVHITNLEPMPVGFDDEVDLTMDDDIAQNEHITKVEPTPVGSDDEVDLTMDDDKPENVHHTKVKPEPACSDDEVEQTSFTMEDDLTGNLHLTKVEPMDADNQVGKFYPGISSEVTKNQIKEEATESEFKYKLLVGANLQNEPASNKKIEERDNINVQDINEEANAELKMHMEISNKRKLKRLLHYTKTNLNKTKNNKKEALKRFLQGCDMYLSPKLSSIVKAHLNSKGEEFANDYKLFCLNLYISNPTTYIVLSQVLCFPSKNELIKSNFPIQCKTNKQTLEILGTVADKMSKMDKECVLTIGEIRLKKSIFYDAKADRMFGLHEIDGKQKPCGACCAYTVMLQGASSDWKLLIGFSLTLLNKMNPDSHKWLTDTISQLFQLGFQIRAVNCPVTPMFMQFASQLGVGVVQDKHKITHFEVDGKKVYFIFDIGSILKRARNALCVRLFTMNEKRATWNCLKQLYQLDHKSVKRHAPRLTKLHLKPKKHTLNNLRYASEVMDSSVAGALNIYASKKQLRPCFGTIQFIHMMSRVYKVLRSDKPIPCSDEEKRLFSQMRNLLNSIVVCDKKTVSEVENHNSFINSLLITMDSICQMRWDRNLVIKRQKLTSSCRLGLQPFYNVIRQLSGHSKRVTCIEYLRGFRRCFLFHALTLAEKKDRASTDHAAFLEKYETYVQKNNIYQTPKRRQRRTNVLAALQHAPEETRFIHFCSYLLHKCVVKHDCPMLRKYVSSSVVPLKSGEGEAAGLKVPPDHFLIYCDNLENYLEFSLKSFVGANVVDMLVNRLKQLYFDKPCPCFPVDLLLKTFVMLRIRYNNMMHRKKWSDENSKSAKYNFNRM